MRISDSQHHGNAPQERSTPPVSVRPKADGKIPGAADDAARATLTKEELVNAVYSARPGLSRHDAKSFVDAVLEEIISALTIEEKVSLREFGTFTVRQKRERIGRNPRTGVSAPIRACKVVTFRPSHTVKAIVDGD